MKNVFTGLPSRRYKVVLADPPWAYYGQQNKWAAAAKFYKTLSAEELSTFPMHQLIEEPAVIFLWATCPQLDTAIHVMKDWGFYYRGVAFVWVKVSKRGVPWGARGVRPSIVKPVTELVLVGATVCGGRPLPLASERVVQTVFAPVGEHSVKPGEVQERIEELYPDLPKIELFARNTREGWDCWGDEVRAVQAGAARTEEGSTS